MIAQYPAPQPEWKLRQYYKETPEKQVPNPYRFAPLHTKARLSNILWVIVDQKILFPPPPHWSRTQIS